MAQSYSHAPFDRRVFHHSRKIYPPEVVIRGAGAFRGDHQCAERSLRRTGRPEDLALMRLDDALQDFAALAGFRIGDLQIREREFSLGVEFRISLPDADAGMIDRSEAAPFKELAQLEDLIDCGQRGAIANACDDAGILVFDFAAPRVQLLEQHPHRLQDVERLEAGDDYRLAVVARDEIVRLDADHHADVTRSEESVEPQFRRIQNGLDRRNDRDVITE